MEAVPIFLVQKFFPPRCPKCEHPFISSQDFSIYGGERGSSFLSAKIRQAELLPELFGVTQEVSPGVFSSSDKFDADFIICSHCNNITFRIQYGSRTVMTRDEAVRLVTTEGFTCWQEGAAFGNMARPRSFLSILGAADLQRLKSLVIQAKQSARGDPDAFASVIDPALAEIVNKVRESRNTAAARDRLSGMFGTLWEALAPECRDFLLTAEVLKDDLVSLTETDPSIDFSPAVQMYSKALEKDLLEKLFRPFASSTQAYDFPATAGKQALARSVAALQSFVTGSRELTLGDMAFCLLNLGCKMRRTEQNGFAEFLQTKVSNRDVFCDDHKFPGRLIEYAQEYRNKSAHVAKLSKDACMSARAFLLEEPIRLLILLEEFLRSAGSDVAT